MMPPMNTKKSAQTIVKPIEIKSPNLRRTKMSESPPR